METIAGFILLVILWALYKISSKVFSKIRGGSSKSSVDEGFSFTPWWDRHNYKCYECGHKKFTKVDWGNYRGKTDGKFHATCAKCGCVNIVECPMVYTDDYIRRKR